MADSDSAESPYLSGRREWLERYGSYIQRARQWRLVALVALGLAVVSVLGVVVLASQIRIVPYVVEVDGRGRAVGVYEAERLAGGTPALFRAVVARWIEDWRTVATDGQVQRKAVDRVYAHLPSNSPGSVAVTEWYRENTPFERAAKETVAVEVEEVLQLEGGDTWRAEWRELVRTRAGAASDEVRVTATLTLVRGDVDAQAILANPLGLYVQAIDWSEDYQP